RPWRATAGGAVRNRRRDGLRDARSRPARPDRDVQHRRADAGRGVGGAGRARHLRLGRQLLRARADAAARPGGVRRRGPGGCGALQHGRRAGDVPGRRSRARMTRAPRLTPLHRLWQGACMRRHFALLTALVGVLAAASPAAASSSGTATATLSGSPNPVTAGTTVAYATTF